MKRNSRIEEELFPFYALDALTAEERAEVEAYVAADPEAQARLAELIEGAALLGVGTEPIAPPPAIKQHLMQRIQEAAAEQPTATTEAATHLPPVRVPSRPSTRSAAQAERPRNRPFLFFATALSAAVAVAAIALALFFRSQVNVLQAELQALQVEAAAIETQLNGLEVENANLRQQINEQTELLAIYQQPGTITTTFGDATGNNPAAVGTLTYEPETQQAMLRTSNLEPLDQQAVYQLWLIHEDVPVSAGTFEVDESGSGSLVVSSAEPGFTAVGVSIEPEGGSEQPTPGNIILLGPTS